MQALVVEGPAYFDIATSTSSTLIFLTFLLSLGGFMLFEFVLCFLMLRSFFRADEPWNTCLAALLVQRADHMEVPCLSI